MMQNRKAGTVISIGVAFIASTWHNLNYHYNRKSHERDQIGNQLLFKILSINLKRSQMS